MDLYISVIPATYLTTCCSFIWHLYLETYAVDLLMKCYQYSLRMATWGMKHVGV